MTHRVDDLSLSQGAISPLVPGPHPRGQGGLLRTDIQALRAVAVALVVVYHLWPVRLTGGYVGVDVFFVISGFLITAHLLREMERGGHVSLSRFWARRIRRLLPAALPVLLASLAFTLLVMPPSLQQQNLREIAASAGYVQNWLLSFDSVDYLGSDNQASLVQHFWSLSVEEQFYIVWPLMAVGALFVGRRSRGAVLAVMVAVFLASLAFSAIATAVDPAPAYFSTLTRAWEFAAGGLLAFVPARVVKGLGSPARTAIVVLGLALILASAVLYLPSAPFPGVAAILPVAGTVAVLWAGGPASLASRRAWEWRPAQFIGDTSYAIYLWHWPLIVAGVVVLQRELTFAEKIAVIATALLLGAASKYLIEDKARASRGWFGTRAGAYAFMIAGAGIVIALALASSAVLSTTRGTAAADIAGFSRSAQLCAGAAAAINDCPAPYAVTDTVNPAVAASDFPWLTGIPSYAHYSCATPGDILPRCQSQVGEDTHMTIALVGDSHADHLLEPVTLAAREAAWLVLPYTHAGCSRFEIPGVGDGDCLAWAEAVRAELSTRDDIDVAVFSNFSADYSMAPERVMEVIDGLRLQGIQVILVADTPAAPFDVPSCLERTDERDDPCTWTRPSAPDFMTRAAAEYELPILHTGHYVCPDERCHAVIGGLVTYADDDHFTSAFARTIAAPLAEDLRRLIRASDR